MSVTAMPSGDEVASRTPSPVRDRRFLTFLGGAAMADIGDQAWIVILAYAAARSGDPVIATVTVAAGTVPRAILDLVGGAVADRLPTRPLLVSVAGARVLALAVGLLALISFPHQTIPIMIGVAALFGAADALHKPATFTMPRQLLNVRQVVRAASLRQLVTRLAMLGGPVLAGVALGAFELPGAMAWLLVVFVVAAVLLSLVRVRYQRDPAESETVLASIRGVVEYLKSENPARALVYSLIGLNFFVIPVVNVGVALRVADEGWGAQTLGILMACVGVGAVLGTAITLRIKPRYPMRFALILLVAQGFAIGMVGIMPMVGVGISLGLVGLTAGLSSPMLAGTAQAVVPANYVGRVFAVVGLADDALIPFALIGYGLVTDRIGLPVTTLFCGVGMVLLMLIGLSRRSLRNLRIARPSDAAAPAGNARRSATDDTADDSADAHQARHAADEPPTLQAGQRARRFGDPAAPPPVEQPSEDPADPVERQSGPIARPAPRDVADPAGHPVDPGEQVARRRAIDGLGRPVQAVNGSSANGAGRRAVGDHANPSHSAGAR
jgi:MFS family permease